jgi:hypothetical protein
MTLLGTPTLYYGDEIGMRQVAIAPYQVRDPFEMNVPGIGVGRDVIFTRAEPVLARQEARRQRYSLKPARAQLQTFLGLPRSPSRLPKRHCSGFLHLG